MPTAAAAKGRLFIISARSHFSGFEYNSFVLHSLASLPSVLVQAGPYRKLACRYAALKPMWFRLSGLRGRLLLTLKTNPISQRLL